MHKPYTTHARDVAVGGWLTGRSLAGAEFLGFFRDFADTCSAHL